MATKGMHKNKDPLRILVANVRRLRLKAGFNQEELSRYCNLHEGYVGRLERRPRNVELDSIKKLAKGLRVTVADLFTESSDESQS